MKARFAIALLAVAVLCTCVMAQENTARGWYKRGVELAGNGSYEDAVKAYEKAIELDPNYGAAWRDKGYSLGYLAMFIKDFGRYNESLVAFDRAIYLIPSNDTRNLALAWDGKANTLISMSYALGDMGKQEEAKSKREEAVNDYSKAIELDPSFTGLEAQLYRAGVLAELNRYDEAVAAYDMIIETVPANDTMTMYAAQVWAGKGNVLEKMGLHNEALKAFDKALEMDPSNIAAMQGRGLALNAMGRNSEANTSFAKAKELGYSTFTMVQNNTADYWIKIGDDLALNKSNNQEALAAYEKAIQMDPENIGAWDRKALILYVLDQQAYRKVLNLSEMRLAKNPQDARTWQAHAAALTSLGRQEEANQSQQKALEIYDQEIKDNPKNATAWFYKAELTANRTEALSAYEKVIELNGSMKVEALLTKGNILLNLGKSDEAIAAVDKAIQLDPTNFRAWEEMALVYHVLGKYNESLTAYEKLTKINPENALVWKGKGDALKMLGRQAEANAAFAKAKELGYQG